MNPAPDDLPPPEPRWPALLTLVAVGGIDAALPPALSLGPDWLSLVVMLALAAVMLVLHRRDRHRTAQKFGYFISAVTTAFLVFSVGLLIHALLKGSLKPIEMLRSAALLWGVNVLVFALWYWRLDRGGPHVRRQARPEPASFLFPQMTMRPDSAAARDWYPEFFDYLFLSFNTSTAISPTDTAILSRVAKLLVMMQALISLTIVVILAARAVNIL